MTTRRTARLTWILVLCAGLTANAQTLPSDPIVFGDGLVALGGNVSASIGPDDPGFYNYTDYTYSSLRRFQAALMARVQAGQHISFLTEMHVQNSAPPDLFALYMRIRPWTDHDVDIQVGRVPPTFGAFTHRAYAADNPLIGYPLGYQYLTSLRPDALPADADDLLRMRGRGWLSSFPVGDVTPHHGVPLVTAFRWDTGVQVHASNGVLDGSASITLGTVSNPVFPDDNGGPQYAGRVAVRPLVGLVVGLSAAHGPFVTTAAAAAAASLSEADHLAQDAWGADLEYSRDYYLVRAEAILSRWTLPLIRAPFIQQPLQAASLSVEGRYKLMPGLYAAARVDYLGFSTVTGTLGPRPWDAPVTRLEVGGGYSLQRNLVLKAAYQYDRRNDTRVPRGHFVSTEVVFWF